MAFADTLIVDGFDLRSLPNVNVRTIDFGFSPAVYRGQNETVPGRPGSQVTSKVLSEYSFTVPITIHPAAGMATPQEALTSTRASLRRIVRAIPSGRGITITRRVTDTEVPGGFRTQFCYGEFRAGLEVAVLNPVTRRTELEFVNALGYWLEETTISISTGTVEIDSDVSTRHMTITLPGEGTLVKEARGTSYTLNVGGATTLDVYAGYSSNGYAGLSHYGDKMWFVLEPGTNEISWSGSGSPSIVYRGAWL